MVALQMGYFTDKQQCSWVWKWLVANGIITGCIGTILYYFAAHIADQYGQGYSKVLMILFLFPIAIICKVLAYRICDHIEKIARLRGIFGSPFKYVAGTEFIFGLAIGIGLMAIPLAVLVK